MKYSITVLQAEITRFENGIKEATSQLKLITTHSEDKKLIAEAIKNHSIGMKSYEAQITELKADIKKL